MVRVTLHKPFDIDDIAGVCKGASGDASSEGGISPIVHLAEPVSRIGKSSLKF